jgi:virginiamycin B lyase
MFRPDKFSLPRINRSVMRVLVKLMVCVTSILSLCSLTPATTITGSVKGPDGAPFMGAFVIAENSQNKMTVSVLTDKQGHYHIANLPAATYTVRIGAIGYKSDPRVDVRLASDQKSASFDFVLQNGTVRWSDLNSYQGRMLLPKTKEHDLTKRYQDTFFTSCMISCHSFQTQYATAARDEDGWRDRVKYMRDVIMAGEGEGGGMSDQKVEDIVSYLNTAFGSDSQKTKSPADMPEYKALVRPFSEKAMNIVYVEYYFAGSKGLGPWSAVEDRDGMIWIPYYGRGNEVVRLNPKTAELTRFPLPFEKTAGIHSVIPAPDGTVWFTEATIGGIGHLNPLTKEITEYRDTAPTGRPVGKHTVRVDESGNVWTSGGPISRFDLTTKEFTHFDTPGTYGNVVGKDGDQWFTVFKEDGPIVRITKTGKVSKFYPPTKGTPQRLQVDSDGIVWFTERVGGKIGRFDPKTETFKEFQLPGPAPSPYAIGIDRNHMIWYDSHEQDTIGRLNPDTGEVTEYPFPHSEISMREFFIDSQGRMWFASSSNNRVGYFYFQDPDGASK